MGFRWRCTMERERRCERLCCGLGYDAGGRDGCGEDVTSNVRTIRSRCRCVFRRSALKAAGIPAGFEVRGEVVLPQKASRR